MSTFTKILAVTGWVVTWSLIVSGIVFAYVRE